ncbi:MAG: hypothetical protein M1115_11255 [Actinobacteria bacterium]|nr:hypothetical protein [Actinomycetota bacterium]
MLLGASQVEIEQFVGTLGWVGLLICVGTIAVGAAVLGFGSRAGRVPFGAWGSSRIAAAMLGAVGIGAISTIVSMAFFGHP